MSVVVHGICLNTSEAVVGSSNGMHSLVITEAWDRVNTVAGLFRFGVVHLRRAGIARMF